MRTFAIDYVSALILGFCRSVNHKMRKIFTQLFYAADVIVMVMGQQNGFRLPAVSSMAARTGAASPGSTMMQRRSSQLKPRCSCPEKREY
jgi:hypothetical protein